MNYSKELIKKMVIISITVILVIATIICTVYFINNEKKDAQTFLSLENSTVTEEIENIERIIVILNAEDDDKENTNNETNNTTDNIAKPNIDSTTNNTDEKLSITI